ncbi:CDP-glycerol glycerophosphotransferase [Sinosporangium album]|uniref:CDP-glycerol glycerophosphotransferase n=1 Tax=Sinosporangium album TaxID=504805 RepID=A0A1G8CYV9_9ACTN|nr:CDP-glycerol glycerophosphotransferase family protein [Sinosporangium album]SDH50534.1 CDP-glycerol glycerophosphotransferase [Sinosporangium album]
MPGCSVVVIVYNDAERLPRAVRSVLGQSLRDLEVIIVDDASSDGTEGAARALAAEDPRVRYVRRAANSGGCGAPRNEGLERVRSPYVMFVDSDDELTPHACKSMMAEIERTGADFATGQISRLYETSGRTQRYYPNLYRRRTVDGIAADPEMFIDGFSTNKLYRVDFLREHGLRFREDLHYEDHVFTAELFAVARRFAVVPWPVYLWHRAPEGTGPRTSISLSIREMDNVRHRVEAARASDEILRGHGLAELVPERQHRFLRQDLRVYLNPLAARDRLWTKEFAEVVRPYIDGIEPGVVARLPPTLRVCCHLITADRIDDLAVAARSLTGPMAPPRAAVTVDGRTYWGTEPDPALDITALRLAELPYSAARLRHEVAEMWADGTAMVLSVRTYDPFHVLDRNPRWTAFLQLKTGKVRLAPRRQDDGSYLSEVRVDLAERTPGRFGLGYTGWHEPKIGFTRDGDGHVTTDRLLVDRALEPVEVRAAGHTVTADREGGAAWLRMWWRQEGVRRRVPLLLAARRKVIGKLCRTDVKLKVYKGLIRVVPPRPDLALFEADCGKGYTGNPRYIYEEMRRRELPVRAVWSVAKRRAAFPPEVTLVRRMSWRYIWMLARAGIWVDSHNLPLDFPKPRGTRYLQTWHGQGIKTVGFDAPDLRSDMDGPRTAWRASVARWDALVSPGAEFERVFLPANGYEGPVLRFGSPRCDVLVRGDEEAARRVRERLEIPTGARVLLYAPTYRDQLKRSGRSVRADLARMAERLAGEWVVLLRTHPVERYRVPEQLRHFVRPAGSYPEVNDLMLASDALLTDYSSIMCDYAITGRPMLFLIDDWDEFRLVGRGVYHDLPSIAPGPCVTTTEEVVEALGDLGRVGADYAERYRSFRGLWCAEERGHAAERVVTAFFEPGPRTAAPYRRPRPVAASTGASR